MVILIGRFSMLTSYKRGNSFAHVSTNLKRDDDGAGLVVDKHYTIHIIPSYVGFSFLTIAFKCKMKIILVFSYLSLELMILVAYCPLPLLISFKNGFRKIHMSIEIKVE